jgi:glycine betaine/proline transport system ATP-binding protein
MNKATVSKIEVKNVFKIFGNRAKDALAMIGQGKTKDQVLAETGCVVGVNDLSLSIGSGEIFVIMGLSGSGKSTLVRHFNRLIDPTSGAILVDGVDILQYDMEALREFRRRKISMVFQSFGLLPHKTVLDNVAYGLKSVARASRCAPSARCTGSTPWASRATKTNTRTSSRACVSAWAWPVHWRRTPTSS